MINSFFSRTYFGLSQGWRACFVLCMPGGNLGIYILAWLNFWNNIIVRHNPDDAIFYSSSAFKFVWLEQLQSKANMWLLGFHFLLAGKKTYYINHMTPFNTDKHNICASKLSFTCIWLLWRLLRVSQFCFLMIRWVSINRVTVIILGVPFK